MRVHYLSHVPFEPGMVAIIIRSHGAAHDDQCVKLADVREWVALKQQ